MKKSFQLFFIVTLLGVFSISSPLYGQEPFSVTLVPIKNGSGTTFGNSKTPDENVCPLSLYYDQTIDQLEFQNLETSSVTFTYYIYDEDENVIDYDTVCINVNASYLLYLNSIVGETYKIQIEVDDVVYEGYFGQ